MANSTISLEGHKIKRWLKINSLTELMLHEKEILEHIERMPNGGHLFYIHPFLLLQDIGVELSDIARKELLQYEPRLMNLSVASYQALKNSEAKQHIHFHFRGLIVRRKKL